MKKRKVVYIVSDVEKALAFEWTAQRLISEVDLFFILIGKKNTQLSYYLRKNNISCVVISDEDLPGNFKKWLKIYSILQTEKPDVVHVHLWRAMLLGLSAAWVARIKKRVLTRHHATIHYVEYPSGRKWDILCNALATDIIAISENIKDILIQRDKAKISKVHVVHHGFEFSYFRDINHERINSIRKKYGFYGRPVIGVISRYVKFKGVQYIIPAFKKIRCEFPEAHLVLANAQGDYTPEIKTILKQLPEGSYTEIQFEDDLAALYKIFDVFVHVPIDAYAEAFGQTYVEALAAEVPCVFTLSGVAQEFILDRKNALVVNYKNPEEIFLAIRKILSYDDLRSGLVINGSNSIVSKFDVHIMIKRLMQIYNS
jgi:glycosyltransferase involved in cell wall biosynthesis